jgi:hypothetical protein
MQFRIADCGLRISRTASGVARDYIGMVLPFFDYVFPLKKKK